MSAWLNSFLKFKSRTFPVRDYFWTNLIDTKTNRCQKKNLRLLSARREIKCSPHYFHYCFARWRCQNKPKFCSKNHSCFQLIDFQSFTTWKSNCIAVGFCQNKLLKINYLRGYSPLNCKIWVKSCTIFCTMLRLHLYYRKCNTGTIAFFVL